MTLSTTLCLNSAKNSYFKFLQGSVAKIFGVFFYASQCRVVSDDEERTQKGATTLACFFQFSEEITRSIKFNSKGRLVLVVVFLVNNSVLTGKYRLLGTLLKPSKSILRFSSRFRSFGRTACPRSVLTHCSTVSCFVISIVVFLESFTLRCAT